MVLTSKHAVVGDEDHRPRGTITIRFGDGMNYDFTSTHHPNMIPTDIYMTDVIDQVDPCRHPLYGHKGRKRVYIGWHHKKQGWHTLEGYIAVKWVAAWKDIPTQTQDILKLQAERDNYARLKRLQGRVIPWLLDYITGVFGDVMVACMILERCGSELPRDLAQRKERKRDITERFHASGWLHGSIGISDENFTAIDRQDGDPLNPVRLVSLALARRIDGDDTSRDEELSRASQ